MDGNGPPTSTSTSDRRGSEYEIEVLTLHPERNADTARLLSPSPTTSALDEVRSRLRRSYTAEKATKAAKLITIIEPMIAQVMKRRAKKPLRTVPPRPSSRANREDRQERVATIAKKIGLWTLSTAIKTMK